MNYSIKEMSVLSGVSERTLRYYEELELLKPQRKAENSYRFYTTKEIQRLQQILFYRELDFPLAKICTLLENPPSDITQLLASQKRLLEEKRNRLNELIMTIEQTIETQKGGMNMKDSQYFKGFKNKLIEENEKTYGKEAREKYGSESVDKSNAKMLHMDEATYHEFDQLGKEILEKLATAAETGNPTSEAAQEVAKLHQKWLKYTWTSYSAEAHKNLVEMYTQDERFASYYQGNAVFLRDAVHSYLDQNK